MNPSGSPLPARIHGLAPLCPSDLGLEVGPEFLGIVGIVRFAEPFHKFPFLLLGKAVVPEPADTQANSVGWHHLTRREQYFQGSHEKSVVGPGKLGAPEDTAVLDKSPPTAYEYMVDPFPCTTAIGIPSPAVHVRSLEP